MGNLSLGPAAGNLGFDLAYGNFGEVERSILSGGTPMLVGGFQPTTWLVACGYGADLDGNLSLGLSGKVFMDQLDNDQKLGMAGDVGMVWAPKKSILSLGFSVLNLGALSGMAIPMEARAGIACCIPFKDPGSMLSDSSMNKILFSVDGLTPFQDLLASRAAVGMEFWYHDLVALRLGQQIMNTPGLDGLVGFSMGAGFRDGPIQLDYAFATRGDLGNTNMVTLLARL
jgi:hypothetical protein